MERLLSREELAVSCFDMTAMQAHAHLSEYRHELDEFISNPENADVVKAWADKIGLLKAFIYKAQDYISYNQSSVKPIDDYEKGLLEEIWEKVL
jgi:hypothetical protein